MRVDEQTCPVCEQPRSQHDPECRYETTLQAAAERFAEARSNLGAKIREDWQALLLIFAAVWMVAFAVDRLLL